MVKTLIAASVLMIAGSAVAAPFSVAGAQLAASGGLSDGGAALNFQMGGGIVPNAGANPNTQWQNPAMASTILLGAHSGGAGASGPLDSTANAAPLVASTDDYGSFGDQSFNVGFTIPAAANHVASGAGALGDNDVWVARIPAGAQVNLFQVIFSSNVGLNLDFVIDGPGVATEAGTLFAKTTPVGTARGGFVDVIITDAPAPGAAALLGLAGIAGLRRRRA